MGKKDSKNLDDLFGPTQEIGNLGGFCGNYNKGFGIQGFDKVNPAGQIMEIIDNYEKEVKRADKDTRSDLVNIDIELGKMSYPELAMGSRPPYPWIGAGYSRAKIKESVTNIVKRDREAIAILEATVAVLSAALVITHIKKKK